LGWKIKISLIQKKKKKKKNMKKWLRILARVIAPTVPVGGWAIAVARRDPVADGIRERCAPMREACARRDAPDADPGQYEHRDAGAKDTPDAALLRRRPVAVVSAAVTWGRIPSHAAHGDGGGAVDGTVDGDDTHSDRPELPIVLDMSAAGVAGDPAAIESALDDLAAFPAWWAPRPAWRAVRAVADVISPLWIGTAAPPATDDTRAAAAVARVAALVRREACDDHDPAAEVVHLVVRVIGGGGSDPGSTVNADADDTAAVSFARQLAQRVSPATRVQVAINRDSPLEAIALATRLGRENTLPLTASTTTSTTCCRVTVSRHPDAPGERVMAARDALDSEPAMPSRELLALLLGSGVVAQQAVDWSAPDPELADGDDDDDDDVAKRWSRGLLFRILAFRMCGVWDDNTMGARFSTGVPKVRVV
jgi:hypothetical protein